MIFGLPAASEGGPGGILGRLGRPRGAPGGLLEAAGGVLGACWGVLGAPWPFEAILEASWRHLGRALLRILAPLPSETADSKAKSLRGITGAGGDRDGRWGEDKEGGRL